MTLLSFVIPCYRSEATIEKVIDEIRYTVSERENYDYEIITVNDCSPDGVLSVLLRLASKDKKIKVIDLAKNMGQDCAFMAGYAYVNGDYVVNMDDDYQCPVYELWKLLEPLEKDECDVSTARYYVKRESAFKRFGSNVNLWMTQIMLDKPKGIRFENFSIIKRFVRDEIVNYKNPYPYLEGLIFRVTKKIKTVPMDERVRGDDNSTGFTLRKSLHVFINGITSFSVKPLRLSAIIGAILALLGFIYGVFIVIEKLTTPNNPVGYSSMMAFLLLSNGLILLTLGIIGEYVGRIFICINNSPQYVVRSTVNIDE